MIILNYTDSLEIYKTLQHIANNGIIGFGLPGLMAQAKVFGWKPTEHEDLVIVFNKTKSCYGILEAPDEEYDHNWITVFEIGTSVL